MVAVAKDPPHLWGQRFLFPTISGPLTFRLFCTRDASSSYLITAPIIAFSPPTFSVPFVTPLAPHHQKHTPPPSPIPYPSFSLFLPHSCCTPPPTYNNVASRGVLFTIIFIAILKLPNTPSVAFRAEPLSGCDFSHTPPNRDTLLSPFPVQI